MDAAAHARRLPLRAVVGRLVSGRRAGRRRLRRAAHLLGEDGARRRARDAVLPGRALRASGRGRGSSPVSPRSSSTPTASGRTATRRRAYVQAFVDLLPTPWRGFMMAGFAAAYMSTVATQLNWGASYLVNDFYKRFLKKDETEQALRRGVALGDGLPVPGVDRRDLAARHDRAGLEVPARARRGNGARSHPPLVLVAHQRVERDQRDDRVLRHCRGRWRVRPDPPQIGSRASPIADPTSSERGTTPMP